MAVFTNNEPYLKKDRVENLIYPELVGCSRCQGILWIPKACRNCETAYCSPCIKAWQLETNETLRCSNNCSGFMEHRAPQAILHILSTLKVKCLYTSNGCEETLSYNGLETHEEACGYRLKTCSGCQQEIVKRDFQSHHSTCPLVSLTCSECDTVYERQNEQKHTEIICLRIQLRQQKQKLTQLENQLNSLMKNINPSSVQPVIITELY